MQSSTMSLVKWMIGSVALLVGLSACNAPSGYREIPDEVGSVQSALCINDTHCEYYTDDSFTTLCGERDTCISCTSETTAWGCKTSYRICQTLGECGAQASCYQCVDSNCWDYPCLQ